MNIGAVNSSNHALHTKQAYAKNASNTTEDSSAAIDKAVSVRISSQAMDKLKADNSVASNLDQHTIAAALPSRGQVATRKTALTERVQRQEIEVTGVYNEGTLAHFVDAQLSGKLEKSNQIAEKIETMIRGTVYNKDATIEQRAIDREAALKMAQHMADNYFENPEEAKAFLDTINKFAQNDILREMGYTVLDNSDIAAFKSYTMPNAPADYVRMDYNTLRDIVGGNQSQSEKQDKLKSISNDIVKRFEDNEKSVVETIGRIKAAMSEIDVDSDLDFNLANLFSEIDSIQIDPAQTKKWNDIMSLLNA